MGTQSTDSFGNDIACDWTYDLEEKDGLDFTEMTLQKVLDVGAGYLEAPIAQEAVAAAEVIARLKGNYGVRDSYTVTVDKWVENHPLEPTAALVEKATKAIQRILLEPSELMELWQESDELENWKTSLEDLKLRVCR